MNTNAVSASTELNDFAASASFASNKTNENANFNFDRAISVDRDPDDVTTISSLLKIALVLLVALTGSVALNIYLSLRKADRIVVDKTSGRVVQLNNKDYGATEAVEVTPDRPNDTDKKYLVKQFLNSLYAVEQTTRETEVNKLLRMLDPDFSLALAANFKQNGILATEKVESVNSSWELQDLSVDERDPYILRAIGTRRIRRKAAGQDVEEAVQLKCKFLLKDSPTAPARSDNNLRTGFYIARFRVEPVSDKTVSPLVLLADGEQAMTASTDETSNQTASSTTPAPSRKVKP